MFAAQNGHCETVTFLLDRGANVKAKNNWLYSAADIAEKKGHKEILSLLLENGAEEPIRYKKLLRPALPPIEDHAFEESGLDAGKNGVTRLRDQDRAARGRATESIDRLCHGFDEAL